MPGRVTVKRQFALCECSGALCNTNSVKKKKKRNACYIASYYWQQCRMRFVWQVGLSQLLSDCRLLAEGKQD